MSSKVVVPLDSPNGIQMTEALAECRVVFFAGLPAAGKSLFLQQQVLMAAETGRRIHMLRWDAALAAFETAELLNRYPETDRVTHPVIRKAAGLWSRQAVARWQTEFPGAGDILIGEMPLSGNRFVELAQVHRDDAEPLLAGERARFFVPVPTIEVRRSLESKRRESMANPQHADEARDAPMNTLRLVWRETRTTATELGLVGAEDGAGPDEYDPSLYRRFFGHLLRHRDCRFLEVDTIYSGVESAHGHDADTNELMASPGEVAASVATVEATWSAEEISRAVESWHQI